MLIRLFGSVVGDSLFLTPCTKKAVNPIPHPSCDSYNPTFGKPNSNILQSIPQGSHASKIQNIFFSLICFFLTSKRTIKSHCQITVKWGKRHNKGAGQGLLVNCTRGDRGERTLRRVIIIGASSQLSRSCRNETPPAHNNRSRGAGGVQ